MTTARERFVVDQQGKKTAVIMPLVKYRRLIEDLHDLSVVAERREEPTTPIDDVKRRLRADGVFQD